jgi:hypothetical protein
VTELTERYRRLQLVDEWFAERGFGFVISHAEGRYWADLFSKRGFQVTAPKYGGGKTPEDAAESARQRYDEEQGDYPLR